MEDWQRIGEMTLEDLYGDTEYQHVATSILDKLRDLSGFLEFSADEWAKLSIDTLCSKLSDERLLHDRSDAQGGGILTRLDAVLIPLIRLQRNMPLFPGSPYDIPFVQEGDPMSHYPCLLKDMSHQILVTDCASLLEVKYLGESPSLRNWPVDGILFHPTTKRPLIWLPVSVGRKPARNVIFIVDTGAPITELSQQVFDAFGLDNVPSSCTVKINGIPHSVALTSPLGNHKDIPVLGADFMTAQKAHLYVNYASMTVQLNVAEFREPQVQHNFPGS